jgi:branched-subunit amino acid ABC-type transport system permease component
MSEITVGNKIFGAYITDMQIAIIVVCLALILISLFIIESTRLGKNIRAVAENEVLSSIFGLNSKKIVLWSFCVGSAFAAIAGVLIGFESKIKPSMGFGILFYGVVAMIIGGVGNYKGLLVGALILATAQNLGAYYIDSKWMDAIAYLILIIFLIWKPLGFSGKQLKKVEI